MPRFVTSLIVIAVAGALAYSFSDRDIHNSRSFTTPSVSIDELLTGARQYDGNLVKVSGIVTASVGLMGFGGFRLQDVRSKSEIMVMGSGAIPPVGAALSVTGKFKQAFVIGYFQYAMIVQNF
jgi:hypothetical protein